MGDARQGAAAGDDDRDQELDRLRDEIRLLRQTLGQVWSGYLHLFV